MQYKLVQNTDVKKFNDEINKLLKEGYTLHGDYRISILEEKGIIINSQLLQKDSDKPAMGFNVK